jgi:hypothetical protein
MKYNVDKKHLWAVVMFENTQNAKNPETHLIGPFSTSDERKRWIQPVLKAKSSITVRNVGKVKYTSYNGKLEEVLKNMLRLLGLKYLKVIKESNGEIQTGLFSTFPQTLVEANNCIVLWRES